MSAIAPTIGKAVRSTVFQLMCDYAGVIEAEEANRLKLELAVPTQKRRAVLMPDRAVLCLATIQSGSNCGFVYELGGNSKSHSLLLKKCSASISWQENIPELSALGRRGHLSRS